MTVFDAEQVGIVGSPSSTSEITLDIVGDASERELLGSMVLLEQKLRDCEELALGTVAEVTTSNQWHENIAMRGVIASRGALPNLSGRADVRSAKVAVQAVYRQDGEGSSPSGATLSMSPSTGTTVMRVTDKHLHEIVGREGDDLFYLGDIYKMSGVRLPLNPSDFSGRRGAFHSGVFGPSGVGKSVFAQYYLAGMMRHTDLGVFIIDPQGQFTIERKGEIPFSLQGFARGMGRDVVVKSLATELRLPQDKGLFSELLAKTQFFRVGLNIRSAGALEAAVAGVTDILDKTTKWADLSIDDLLQVVLDGLIEATEESDIYKDLKRDKVDDTIKPEGAAWKLLQLLKDAAARGSRWGRLRDMFEPVASLFNKEGPNGTERFKISRLLHLALERQEGKPRPLVILNMAFPVSAGTDQDHADLLKKLNGDDTKARILRSLFDNMVRIAEEAYNSKERLLNTMVVFDEAWRYAPKSSDIGEVKVLSNQLAGYARDTRKTGVGWMYILQSPHTLHGDVWDQLKSGFRALGYGLTGADLELVRQQVDKPESIALYRSFTQPSNQNRQYPFMLVGAISPLSFTMAPLYTSIFTTFERWCAANADWLPDKAISMASFAKGQAPAEPRGSDDLFV